MFKIKISLAKVWFVVSVGAIGVCYGIAASQWGLFPAPLVERAWPQFYSTFLNEPKTLLTSRVYDREGVRVEKPDRTQLGKTFISSAWEGAGELKSGFRLIGEEGEVLHQWRFDRTELFADISSQRRNPLRTLVHGSLLLPNGDVIFDLAYVGAARLNSCGEVVWKMEEGNHHSVAKGQDGTFWVSAVSQAKRSKSQYYPDGYPGLGSVWIDRLLQVDGDGHRLC